MLVMVLVVCVIFLASTMVDLDSVVRGDGRERQDVPSLKKQSRNVCGSKGVDAEICSAQWDKGMNGSHRPFSKQQRIKRSKCRGHQ